MSGGDRHLVFKAYVPKSERSNKSSHMKQTEYNTGPWTDEEHDAFLRGYNAVGRQWKRIASSYVKTRDRRQVSSHAQKYFQRLKQESGGNGGGAHGGIHGGGSSTMVQASTPTSPTTSDQ